MELKVLGWTSALTRAMEEYGGKLEAGRVGTANRTAIRLWTASGEREAVLSGSMLEAHANERPVTGDWVAFEPESGRIRVVLPRRTCLSRKKAGKAYEEQVLAANVDVMFIVMGLDGDFNVRRLERYLMLAEESGADPVVVLNKSDLCEDLAARIHEVDGVTHAPVVVMAAIEQGSVAQLHRHLEPGQTAVLLGSSGAGKSTIVNALLGESRQATMGVREQDSRGRHTTSTRELFLVPEGWLLIDTPGIRELEVWSEGGASQAAFLDIGELAKHCRFRDCRHSGEPGCAVAEAIERGLMEQERLDSFHKLHRETDAQMLKRRDRIGSKAIRQLGKGH